MAARPPIQPYLAARLAARKRAGALSAESIRNLHKELERYAAYITTRLAALQLSPFSDGPTEQTLAESAAIIREAADQLERRLLDQVGEYRSGAFAEIQEIWLEAAETAAVLARGKNIPISPAKVPNLTIAGAYEALGGAARTWKTALPEYVRRGATELDAIVRGALVQGVSPDKLARQLRPYVSGSKEFMAVAEGLDVNITDLRSLARQALHDDRARTALNASRVMRHNSERISFSEVFNARGEAEVQHFAADPLVEAGRWVLSPDRGSLIGADECDALAATDFHGLGPGIYPVDQFPPHPHPWCRCEGEPVMRPYREIGQPKPMPGRQIPAARARLPRGVSRQEATRIRDRLEQHLAISENLEARRALRELASGS